MHTAHKMAPQNGSLSSNLFLAPLLLVVGHWDDRDVPPPFLVLVLNGLVCILLYFQFIFGLWIVVTDKFLVLSILQMDCGVIFSLPGFFACWLHLLFQARVLGCWSLVVVMLVEPFLFIST